MREVKRWEGRRDDDDDDRRRRLRERPCRETICGIQHRNNNRNKRGGAAAARTVYIISPAPARLFDTASSPKMRAPRFRCGCGEHDDDGGGGGREDDERGGLCGGGGARSTRLRDGERRSSAPPMSM
jgi:hypothetical protein